MAQPLHDVDIGLGIVATSQGLASDANMLLLRFQITFRSDSNPIQILSNPIQILSRRGPLPNRPVEEVAADDIAPDY